MQTGLLRKKMHIFPDFKNKTDDHLNFTLPPTFSFFLEKKKMESGPPSKAEGT